MRISRLVTSLCTSLLTANTVYGLPNPQLPTPSNHISVTDGARNESHVIKRDLVDLRILPLGASIVWGLLSSDLNGFRKPLRDQLRWEGYAVDMVGSKFSGSMKDNDVEATPGYVIDQIHTAAALSYGFKPNVVLINAGTNDCVGNVDINNAASRLESMVNDLWANVAEDTVIIISTILINNVESVNECRAIVNPMYRQLQASLAAEGKPIYLTDFDGWITIDDITQPDGTHPTDEGYRRMAGAWWETIAQANADGAIQPPQDVDLDTVTTTCSKVAGTGVNAGAETQTGSGYDDGIYYHNSEEQGILLTITSQWDRNQWYFARLFNQERDDLLGWINETDGSITYALWRNDGDGVMTKIDDMTNFPNQCIPRGGRFIDLNADGLDDFVCISNPDGALYGVINNGDGSGSSGPTWTSIGLIKDADPNFPQAQVRLGDIDGDGRADFIGLDADGTAHVWRNGGTADVPNVWQEMGTRWTGGDMDDLAGVRFEDLNGDGRDDWMWVADVGTTYTWTNSRSCLKGIVGNGLNVAWRQGFYTGATSGPTHLASFDGDVDRDRIHFARIYGESAAFSLLGRQDYVYMEHIADGDLHTFNMRVWQNTGSGAAKLKADGDKYGNMQGSATGRQDYVWAYSGGKMIIFPNGGVDYITEGESYWIQPQQDMFDPQTLIGQYLDRRDLHLTDFDGDGKDDIVWTDPDNDNHVSVFINQYDGTTWSWEYQADPAPALSCPYTKGIGIHDIPIRWGDISGNGRDDYVCIAPDGTMSGYVHETDGSWTYNTQFFGPKGYDRANFQLGDVNGDGKVDIIWTEKFSGDGYVYYNDGPENVAGSSYHWDVDADLQPAYAYAGNVAGTCTYYNDLNGDGRVDQHIILESFNNNAETSYNLCAGDHVGDDEDPYTDPGLPIPATTAPATTTAGGITTTAPIGVSSITPMPTCVIAQDPDAGISTAYCVCSDYDTTLPTLAGTSSPCAYTALPTITAATTAANTAGYTYTDPYGDVIACSTSSVDAIGGITYTACAGGSKTLVTGTPLPAVTAACRVAEDPDQGINTAFCTCDDSPGYTLPTLTGSLPCDYTFVSTVTLTPTTTVAATPTPKGWADVDDVVSLGACGVPGQSCQIAEPVFTDDIINDFCQSIIDSPNHHAIGVAGVGGATWARGSKLDCALTGPLTVDECHGIFVDVYSDPDCAVGKINGSTECQGYIDDPDGTYLGILGITGSCVCSK
ncbi:hypothetical protein PFICI_14998 [Pestalotiopsis fici W106-1]|uniref:SGNH hydrolase-type esterase domain-containing protein n=1 Tax=Pestalotiopsis fici (strain W106-1 / CGMCC3.15140) TaxID=1229662 RepID=W3WHM1_PESFW|nr:uncharacterized protein PFICI_14998 [Pestalotiopsis fici W106-1]ETS73393.1 hypothetical protein PFICI_14998 [Pestalotiopsis fici W106-1]